MRERSVTRSAQQHRRGGPQQLRTRQRERLQDLTNASNVAIANANVRMLAHERRELDSAWKARVEDAQEAGRKSLLLLIRRSGEPRFVALSITK